MKWLQLDTDMPHDPRIRAVARALGVEGIGALTCLWCFIGRHGHRPGHGFDSAGRPLPLEDVQEASQLDPEKFRQLVEICVATGHFKADVWQQKHGIWIPAMERRGDTYAKRRAQQQLKFEGQW